VASRSSAVPSSSKKSLVSWQRSSKLVGLSVRAGEQAASARQRCHSNGIGAGVVRSTLTSRNAESGTVQPFVARSIVVFVVALVVR
jgi:hypothetical protein